VAKKNWLLQFWGTLGGVLRFGRQLAETLRRKVMKVWMKPQVREQEVGLEVTSYLPAEIDVI